MHSSWSKWTRVGTKSKFHYKTIRVLHTVNSQQCVKHRKHNKTPKYSTTIENKYMLSSLNDTTQHVMWFNMYLAIWCECEHYSKCEHQVWSLLLFMTLSPECFLINSASAKMVSDQQTVEVNLLSLSTNYSSHPSFLGPLLNIVIAISSQQSMSVIINESMWLEDHTISCCSVRNKLKVAHPVSWSSL